LDARWGSHRSHQEASPRRPTWSRRCPPCCIRSHAYSRHQLSDVAEGLHFLHSRNIVHGDLKGVRDCSNPVLLPC
jgi:serine/threonine protein kinase